MILDLNGLNAYDAKINQTLLEKSLGNCKNIAPISQFSFFTDISILSMAGVWLTP